MNLRYTIILMVAAIAVGVVAIINPFDEEEETAAKEAWFYQIDMDDIEIIEVTHQGEAVGFVKTGEYTWAFQDPPTIPPSHFRWAGGIKLLLSGPRTLRDITVLAETIEDPAQYGLDNPQTIVDLQIVGNRHVQFRLGDTTLDGNHHYGQVTPFPQLYLISNLWGDVITRLVTDPPLPAWYVKHEPESIVELNLWLGDYGTEEAPFLQIKRDEDQEGAWVLRHVSTDYEPRPVDMERWSKLIPLLSGSPNMTVVRAVVEDQDYTQWGITEDSHTIQLRFSGVTEKGTNFTDGVTFRLGDKTSDQRAYYAKWESTNPRIPVLLLDAQWTEALFALFDDLPLAQETDAQTSTQTN